MSYYPKCGRCGNGCLLPVKMGSDSNRNVTYRCTNLECNARFDEYGYEVFDVDTQTWKRLTEG